MRKIISLLAFFIMYLTGYSQYTPIPGNHNYTGNERFANGVAIGDTGKSKSAILELKGTKGGFKINSVTTSQMLAISSPVNGLQVFNSDSGKFYYYISGVWTQFAGGAVGATGPTGAQGATGATGATGPTIFPQDSVTQYAWSLTGNSGTDETNFIGTTDSKELYFKTKNTTAIVVDTNQNVGIGTTAPTASLDIKAIAGTGVSLLKLVGEDGSGAFNIYSDMGEVYLSEYSPLTCNATLFVGKKTKLGGDGGESPTLSLKQVDTTTPIFRVFDYSNLPMFDISSVYNGAGGIGYINFGDINNARNGTKFLLSDADTSIFIDSRGRIDIGSNLKSYIRLGSNNAGTKTQIFDSLRLSIGVTNPGYVLMSRDVSGNAIWGATAFTSADSVTIYALTPTAGTVYFCTNCTGNGFTGHAVYYAASLWRRWD